MKPQNKWIIILNHKKVNFTLCSERVIVDHENASRQPRLGGHVRVALEEIKVTGLGSSCWRVVKWQICPHLIEVGCAVLTANSRKELRCYLTHFELPPVNTFEPLVLFNVLAAGRPVS